MLRRGFGISIHLKPMKVCYTSNVVDRLRCFVSLCDPCIRWLWYVVASFFLFFLFVLLFMSFSCFRNCLLFFHQSQHRRVKSELAA